MDWKTREKEIKRIYGKKAHYVKRMPKSVKHISTGPFYTEYKGKKFTYLVFDDCIIAL